MNAQGLPPPPPGAPRHCPDCSASLADAVYVCPTCGLSLSGPTAHRLWWIDTELTSLREREQTLVRERPGVLARLRWESEMRRSPAEPRDASPQAAPEAAPQAARGAAQQAGPESAAAPAAAVPAPAESPAEDPAEPSAPEPALPTPAVEPTSAVEPTPAAAHGTAHRTGHPASTGPGGEVSGRSAQNIILGLGGLLVGIAALVFAIWTWSDMSTGARTAVLGATTLAFAGLAHPLYKRGLNATAETFGALAAGLLCVDALALWLLADQITNGPGYTAAALAVMSALLVIYPALVPLRSPWVLAALFTQLIPLLLVISLPTDGSPVWLLPVLAATALADVLVVRRLGLIRVDGPVRTLHAAALVLGALALGGTAVAVFADFGSTGRMPDDRWALAAVLFLAGVTGLLLDRWRRPATASSEYFTGYTVVGLGALALMPLVAGPAHLPVLPRLASLWGHTPAEMTAPAMELMGLEQTATQPPQNLAFLAGVLVAAGLAAGAVLLLRRSALPGTLACLAPVTLLAVPLLLGLPQTVAVGTALVAGGGLVLGSALLPGRLNAVPVITGALTLVTGLAWALPERYTTLAALLFLAVTAVVCAAGARRAAVPGRRPRPGDRAAILYMGSALLWGLALLIGAFFLAVNRGEDGTVQAQWWMLTAVALLSGATALLLSRVPTPSSLPEPAKRHGAGAANGASRAHGAAGHGAAEERSEPTDLGALFTLVGLLLLPIAPLLALPARTPALTLFSAQESWSAPAEAMWAPAHSALGLPAQTDFLSAVGYSLALLLVGALALGVVALTERHWLSAGLALTVPPVLVPLPVLLGAPLAAAVVWTLLVGAALFLWVTRLRPTVGWLPGLTGLATMLLALSWSLPQQHLTLVALLLAAATVLPSALAHRGISPATEESKALLVYGLTGIAWGVALAFGCGALIASAALGAGGQMPWWLLGAITLLLGATALVLGHTDRTKAPEPKDQAAAGVPGPFSVMGLLLLAAAPAVVGRGLPAPVSASGHTGFTAPASVLWDPAHGLIGIPVPVDTASAIGVVLGIVVAGALALGTVWLLDRGLSVPGLALVAPLTLVPLPVLLGAPFSVAVLWTLLIGAALFLWATRLPSTVGWLPGLTGLATMVLALIWALPQQHLTLVVLLLAATAVLLSALAHHRKVPGTEARLVYGLTVFTGTGVFIAGFATLVATATLGTPDQGHTPWWLLGGITLLLGAAALVLGRTERERSSAPAGPTEAAEHSAAAESAEATGSAPPAAPLPYSVLGLLLLAAAPLVVGPRGIPALSFFSWTHGTYAAPLEALLDPAHTFIGIQGPPDTLSAVTVPIGLLVAGVLALGAVWLLDREKSVPALALVTPLTLVPLPVAVGATFLSAMVWTLAVGALLLTGSALVRDGRFSWMPWLTGLATMLLALSWALSERYSTVGVLLVAAVTASVVSAMGRTRFAAVASTATATTATGGFALTLLLALNAPTEYAAFGPIAVVAAVAAVAPRLSGPLLEATEIPAAFWAVSALMLTVMAGARLELVAVALAVVGVVSLASGVRPHREALSVVGGVLMFCALWTALASWNVTVPEAYTAPPAIAFLVIGWEWSRKAVETPSSWLAYGGGLALLLGPTVWLVLMTDDMAWRVPAVLAVGLAITVWGLRQRLQAVLVIGGAALLVTSLRAFGPPLWDLTLLLPNWLPFAVVGVVLLVIGARYEASLERLRRAGRFVATMH
ncbi:hypothetical protein GCM10028793_01770 [Nocardiopsis oceani]